MMKGIGGRADHRVFGQASEGIDSGQPFRVATRQVGVGLDYLWPANAASRGLGRPEMAEAHERVVATPFLTLAQPRPLDAPEWPLHRVGAGGNANTGML